MSAVVELRGVGKTYGWRRPRRALEDVWVRVEPGECFGLVGPNGAGKTTLIRLMLGLSFPDEGEARLFGESPQDPGLRRRVGFVPEAAELSPGATPRQLVRRLVRLRGLEPAEVVNGVAHLERLGVAPLIDRPVGKFSKGERQRTLLALALLGAPELLVLDEPTDGLDPLGRALVRQVVQEERARGRTVFLNSHLLTETEKLCSRVAILHRGRLQRVEHMDRQDQEPASVIQVDRLPPPAALDGLRVHPVEGHGPAAVVVKHRELAGLNRAIDALRAAGISISAINPLRTDLERSLAEVAGTDRQEGMERPSWASEPAAPLPPVQLRPLERLAAIGRVGLEIVAELASQRVGWLMLVLVLLAVLVVSRSIQTQMFQAATSVGRSAIGDLDPVSLARLTRFVSSAAAQVLYWALLGLLTVMSSLFAVPFLDPRRAVILHAQPLSRADVALGLFTGALSLAVLAATVYTLVVFVAFRWFGLPVPSTFLVVPLPLAVAFVPVYAVVLLATYVMRSGLFATIAGLGVLLGSVALAAEARGTEGGAAHLVVLVGHALMPKLVETGSIVGRLASAGSFTPAPLVSTALVGLGLVIVLMLVASRRES